ncbi:hypothetical protein LINGRAPRIM_LOCUS1485 [Linum grandiflorum]
MWNTSNPNRIPPICSKGVIRSFKVDACHHRRGRNPRRRTARLFVGRQDDESEKKQREKITLEDGACSTLRALEASSDSVVIDEVELPMHQQLEKLYRTTDRAGRCFSPSYEIGDVINVHAVVNATYNEFYNDVVSRRRLSMIRRLSAAAVVMVLLLPLAASAVLKLQVLNCTFPK